jgi:hypothetical protein
MNKLITSFTLAFLFFSILASVFEGGGGTAATLLTNLASSSDTSIEVDSTQGFMSSGVIFCQGEKMLFADTTATEFTGLTRGYEDTAPKAHPPGAYVYNEDAGILNTALGFTPAAIAASNGFLSVALIPWNFFTITMPRLILWNFNFFQGDLVIIQIILQVVSIGFYMAFVINFLYILKPK